MSVRAKWSTQKRTPTQIEHGRSLFSAVFASKSDHIHDFSFSALELCCISEERATERPKSISRGNFFRQEFSETFTRFCYDSCLNFLTTQLFYIISRTDIARSSNTNSAQFLNKLLHQFQNPLSRRKPPRHHKPQVHFHIAE
jgi:hypothetical protein